jgi:hypothetical protein
MQMKTPLLLAATLAALATAQAAPGAALAASPSPSVSAPKPDEAYEIGREAYDFLFPIVLMELTRQQFTNVAHVGDGFGVHAPMNAFGHAPAFPPAGARMVVRPNFDTLYSVVWLDVAKEPVIVSTGDMSDRYFLLPLMDMWTDVFASPGTRTTGAKAQAFAVVAPGWKGALPAGVSRIESPTSVVWIIGRIQTNGAKDYANVHALQTGIKATPLSQWGKPHQDAVGAVDPAVDMKVPPKLQMGQMPAERFYSMGAGLMSRYGVHLQDQTILPRLARIGIIPGRAFDWSALPAATREALSRAAADGHAALAASGLDRGEAKGGWRYQLAAMGSYGADYHQRAVVAQNGLGANLKEDAVYPSTSADADGQGLDGAHRYQLHFNKADLPPVRAFWSLTLYDKEGFQAANAQNRFAIGDRDDLTYNPDGSLDLVIQADDPGPGRNWLPAPKTPFNLSFRAYWPKAEILDGSWRLPPVRRVDQP